MIKFENFDPREQMFTYVFTDGRPNLHFAIDRMNTWAAREGADYLALVPVEEKQALHLEQTGVAEGPRLRELELEARKKDRTGLRLYDVKPLLVIVIDDGRHIIVDGNHRYVVEFRLGHKDMPAFVLPEAIWRRFLVDLPPDIASVVSETIGKP